MTSSVENIKLGSVDVSFGGVDLGFTKGGVSVQITTQTKQVMVDQFGQSILNDYIQGRSGMVKVPMAESDLTKLVAVIPGAALVGTTEKKMTVPTAIGTSLIDFAKVLILHPTALEPDDKTQDFTAALASPSGNLSFDYQYENERVYQVEFQIYPNTDTGLLYTIGDPAITP